MFALRDLLSFVKKSALVTLPVWGLVLFIGVLSLIPGAAESNGNGLIAIGLLLAAAGVTPVLQSAMSTGEKVFCAVAYLVVSLVAMFIVGWASLGLFGLVQSP